MPGDNQFIFSPERIAVARNRICVNEACGSKLKDKTIELISIVFRISIVIHFSFLIIDFCFDTLTIVTMLVDYAFFV